MNRYILIKLTHLSFRLLSMLAKFLLIISIGKYLSNEALGEYSLFFSTVTIAIFFLGMDFYVFNTREIISKKHEEQAILIRDQFIFYSFTYIVFLPLLLFVFYANIINIKYLFLFYLVLVVEHLSQEIYRLFITLSKQTLATVLLFLRTGIWVYALLLLWFLGIDNYKTLTAIYVSWFIAALISIIIAIYTLVIDYGIKNFIGKINFQWIKHGLHISFSFFMGTLSYKIVEFSNRYVIDFFMTKSDVGVFTFYANIANALQTLVYTLVIMMYYPKLLALYEKNDELALAKIVRNFNKEVIFYSLLCSVAIIVMAYPLFKYLGKDVFWDNISILWLLLAATFFLNLSFVPHYQLFAQKKDILIRNITILIAVINIILTFMLVYTSGLYGAAISALISFLLMFLVKKSYV